MKRQKMTTGRGIAKSVYQKLVREIGAIYEGTRRALVEAYWETGQSIVRGEQKGEIRAAYGDNIIASLSQDLSRQFGCGFSIESLKRMRRFYLNNPKGSPATQLTWAHHIELLSIPDKKKRLVLERRVEEEGLNRNQVRELVREQASFRLSSPGPVSLLTPHRGRFHTHRIALKGGALYLDLGFRIYRRLAPTEAARYGEGDIVKLLEDGSLRKLPGASAADLYTYEAALDHICDGDTQWYYIFTGRGEGQGSPAAFGKRNTGGERMKNDKLRLRGIDCPELKCAAGKAAKRFVEELFRRATGVTVTTAKPDKFDRYLSDIFLRMKDGTELFLNNELLAAGHARLYNDPKPKDWGD